MAQPITLFKVVRWSKPFLVAALVSLFSQLTPSTAWAQESPSSTAQGGALPEAPGLPQIADKVDLQQASTGSITGTVLDTNLEVMQGVGVTLAGGAGFARTVESGANGEFAFRGLPPDVYKLTVTAPGMSTFTSLQIPLQAGETRILPAVKLSVLGGVTNVTVSGNKEQLSKEQVQIALRQRIGGVLPNFYSSYDWNAPPLLAKQKFQLGIRSVFDPVAFLSVGAVAGVQQSRNVFPAYGGGVEGYWKRYGANFANHAIGIWLGKAVYPSIFHQDPRYFYKGKGSVGSRALYAISAAVIARGDDGRWEPNYSRVFGNFSAAAVSNLYYPASDRGASLILSNGLVGIGEAAASNLIREFLLKRITRHVSPQANGKP
jgi:Carboxypeptidase regulatory-like domain